MDTSENVPQKIIITVAEAIERRLVGRGDTEWTNPCEVNQTLEIFLGPVTPYQLIEQQVAGDKVIQTARTLMLPTFVGVVIKPGETVKLPSEWDRVIHRVHRGAIVGGSAPALRRAGQTEKVDIGVVPPEMGGGVPSGTMRRVFED